MASHLNFMKNGFFVGGGVDKTIVLGFQPKLVKIVNITDSIQAEKFESMEADKALRTLQAGTKDYGDYITINSDGFTVKAALAVSAKELHYVASESLNE